MIMNKTECLQELRKILDNDNDNMNEENLYNRIRSSSGTDESLAKIYEIPVELVKSVRKIVEIELDSNMNF